MHMIGVLIEAEAQLDWGTRSSDVARALDHLTAVAPDSPMLRPLQLKLVQLRMADELCPKG